MKNFDSNVLNIDEIVFSFQKFRDSNPFGPQSDSGRLTVINSGSLRQQTPSQPRFYID